MLLSKGIVMLRSWQGCFVLTAIVFLLQAFPFTGIFLMMLAAPFWSVILINLGFALIVRDVWVGVQSRWLIFLPVLWFGGYLSIAAISHWQAYRFNAQIAEENNDKKVRFDQTTQDILIVPDSRDSYNGSALTPDKMIKAFGLHRAYQVRNVDRDKEEIQGWILSGSACPGTMGGGVFRNGVWQALQDGGYGTDRKRTSAKNLCLFISPAEPKMPVFKIQSKARTERQGLTNLMVRTH